MRFENLILLHLLWLLPVLWILLRWFLHRRQSKMALFVEKGLLETITSQYSLNKFKSQNWFILISFVFMVLALARPQWGYSIEKVKQQGLDIILAVDVSKSMLSSDVKPNRLERTKLAIKDLLKRSMGIVLV